MNYKNNLVALGVCAYVTDCSILVLPSVMFSANSKTSLSSDDKSVDKSFDLFGIFQM